MADCLGLGALKKKKTSLFFRDFTFIFGNLEKKNKDKPQEKQAK